MITRTLLLLCLLLPSIASAQSAPLPELVRSAGRAVVSLRTYDAAGTPLGQGSGFLVRGGRVVTNAHVVEGAARVEVYDHEQRAPGGLKRNADHLSLSPAGGEGRLRG